MVHRGLGDGHEAVAGGHVRRQFRGLQRAFEKQWREVGGAPVELRTQVLTAVERHLYAGHMQRHGGIVLRHSTGDPAATSQFLEYLYCAGEIVVGRSPVDEVLNEYRGDEQAVVIRLLAVGGLPRDVLQRPRLITESGDGRPVPLGEVPANLQRLGQAPLLLVEQA